MSMPFFFRTKQIVILLLSWALTGSLAAVEMSKGKLEAFLKEHCYDCHDSDVQKGGLDLASIGVGLEDEALMATWVRIHDRVRDGEMPPAKKARPGDAAKRQFLASVSADLTVAHQQHKGTVLRRLNRQEYENTLNDLFGTHLDIKSGLPEDGRSHGFDTVGDSLNISMVQMQAYLDSADRVIEESIAAWPEQPEVKHIKASYADTREGKKFIGDKWKLLPDGAVVFFQRLGYPSGMLREASVREAGFYKIRVTGYAYQSDRPVTFSVGSTTFARGLEKPTYGYYSFDPGAPSTVELTAWVGERYMIQIEPWGIFDNDYEIKRVGLDGYKGPGLAILGVELEGPLHDEYPKRGHHLLYDGIQREVIEPRNPRDKQRPQYVPQWKVGSESPEEDASKVLLRIARKAFRRPVEAGELKPYLDLVMQEMDKGAIFDLALKTGVTAILSSPEFLFFREKPGRLDDFALASRLSYFLTRSLPDDELMQLAAAGKLTADEGVLMAQVDRLLKDPRAERFVEDFTDSWLDLRSIEFTNPDDKLFPEFDAYLQWSMLKETRGFFRHLMEKDLSVANLIDSDFAIINNRLAEHYGIPAVLGTDFERVKLPADSPRGGVMAHASVLKVSANGTATSPVMRGVWVLERMLGITPPPPPPAVPGVEPDIRGAQTIRQLLEKHRSMTSCQGCHQKIDPPGFALEQFNPIGGFRDHFRSMGQGEKVDALIQGRKVRFRKGLPVDASGALPDGTAFSNFDEFKQLLMKDKEQVMHCLTEKLLTFSTGRELGFSDREEVNRMVQRLEKEGEGLKTLIKLVVLSDVFQSK